MGLDGGIAGLSHNCHSLNGLDSFLSNLLGAGRMELQTKATVHVRDDPVGSTRERTG